MVTTLFDVFSWPEMADMIAWGFIRSQAHTNNRYVILNYTQRTHTAHLWNDVTTQCRGLIYDSHDGRVVARPFPKFFNYGEETATKRKWSVDEPVLVTDKVDGSLGISYLGLDYKPYIATRGSFTSEQSIKATQILREKYPEWYPDEGLTYLFEIIYPENRIVVDYGQKEDLILLGAVNIATGSTIDPNIARLNWSGPVVEVMPYKTFKEALEAPPRENAEGVVVHFLRSDQRVKIKQDDYVELHRIVSNLDAQVVWQYLKERKPITDLVDSLPEEFEPWIHETSSRLLDEYGSIKRHVEVLVEGWLFDIKDNDLRDHEARKYFATNVTHSSEKELSGAFFAYFDGNTERANSIIWNSIKPSKEKVKNVRNF